eukprot:TRINITY_DN11844_c0_g1_i1.p1 TRINITY_DN11844_c0_g1~~TRINITY_DN11844_c0_g1_i1.p1  ORF type:complete len:709 (-),score=95.47 TRINITY_DN11844_c0_g1_i1:83-2209(-)
MNVRSKLRTFTLCISFCLSLGAVGVDSREDETDTERCMNHGIHGKPNKRSARALLQFDSATIPANLPRAVHWGFVNANASAIAEFEAWDREEGPSAPHRPGINLSDSVAWPPIRARRGGWNLPGVVRPRVVVVSMPDRVKRRHVFRRLFHSLNLAVDAQWSPAVEGKRIPQHLRWLTGFANNSFWDHDKPGTFGCFVSHLAILRQSHDECPDCDLVVFEDDAIFAPNFLKRFTNFVASLPPDWKVLRIGGESLWTPPFEYTPKYVLAEAYANTWGYVVKASKVARMADLLATLPIKGFWGIDALFQLFAKELKTFAPTVPLVYTNSKCHDTAENRLHVKGCEERTPSILKMYDSWPLGYHRTYCFGPGKVKPEAQNSEQCKGQDPASIACCPYYSPPTVKRRVLSKQWQQKGSAITTAVRVGFNNTYYAARIPHVGSSVRPGAGIAFALDVREIVPVGVGFISDEKCWSSLERGRERPADRLVTFLGDPRSHALAQFSSCTNSSEASDLAWAVTSWLERIKQDSGRGDSHNNTDNVECYKPLDPQIRAMSCTADHHPGTHISPGTAGQPTGDVSVLANVDNDLELTARRSSLGLAITNTQDAFFVGIAEFYQESLCVFHAKANPDDDLPTYCNCKDSLAWSSFKSQAHGVGASKSKAPHLARVNITPAVLEIMDGALHDEQRLYDMALERFKKQVHEVEQERLVKILC